MAASRIGKFCAQMVILALALAGCARSAPVPTDAGGFTSYAAAAFSEALPDNKVTIKGPLLLEIGPEPHRIAMSLGNAHDFCLRDPQNCDRATREFVANSVAAMKETSADPRKEDIRVVVRGAAYVQQVLGLAAVKADLKPLARPIAGDIWLLGVIDRQHAIAVLNNAQLAKLGLSEDEAIALGKQNVMAALRPFSSVTGDVPAKGVGVIQGDFYESSRLLFHDDWAALANKLGGQLVIAVPAPDLVIYGKGSDRIALDAISAFVNEAAKKAQRPISATLFRWVPEGWQPISSTDQSAAAN
jgi:uncharacterized protein YtpQ (UPF0354 family)